MSLKCNGEERKGLRGEDGRKRVKDEEMEGTAKGGWET